MFLSRSSGGTADRARLCPCISFHNRQEHRVLGVVAIWEVNRPDNVHIGKWTPILVGIIKFHLLGLIRLGLSDLMKSMNYRICKISDHLITEAGPFSY